MWKQNSENFAAQIGAGGTPKAIKADSVQLSGGAEQQDLYYLQIMNKLKYGQELTPDELQYLRVNYPKAYKEAMEQIRAGEAFEEELRDSETKEEARMKQVGKLASEMSQLKSAEARGDVSTAMVICGRVNRMAKVFTAFAASDEFAKMPDDAVEKEEIREEESVLPEVLPEEETEKAEEDETAEETEESGKTAETAKPDGETRLAEAGGRQEKPSEHADNRPDADGGTREISSPEPRRHAALAQRRSSAEQRGANTYHSFDAVRRDSEPERSESSARKRKFLRRV